MPNILTYKDFIGSVEFSLEDEVLHGKILYINGLITYEADTIHQLKTEFESAVDDYISFCQEQGLDAYKSFNGKFNVRLTPELHKAAALLATKEGKSLNAFVSQAIEDQIAMISRDTPSKEIAKFTQKFSTYDFSTNEKPFQKKPLKLHQTKVESYAEYK